MDRDDLIERDRGILTQKDREYLYGEVDLSKYDDPDNQEYQFRYRIRQRVKNAIKDFIILQRRLDRQERQKIYEDVREFCNELEANVSHNDELPGRAEMDTPLILNGSRDAFQFIFSSLMEARRQPPYTTVEGQLKYAIQQDMALYGNEFYFGEITVHVDDFDEYSIEMDVAEQLLREIVLSKHDKLNLQDEEHFSDFVEFIDSIPDMTLREVMTLVEALYRTGRVSQIEHDQLQSELSTIAESYTKSKFESLLNLQ